jgi:hypothetical protein
VEDGVLRFKYFAGNGAQLESQINGWLETYEPEITQMSTAVVGDSVTISFLFDESFRGQERRLSEQRGISANDEIAVPERFLPDDTIQVSAD